MPRLCFYSLFFVATSVYSASEPNTTSYEAPSNKPEINPVFEKNVMDSTVLKAPTHTTNPQTGLPQELWFDFQYLYLKPQIEIDNIYQSTIQTTSTGFTTSNQRLGFDYHWNQGARGTLGFILDEHDAWDVALTYTFIQGSANLSRNLDNFILDENFLVISQLPELGSQTLGVKANWNLYLQLADGGIGRNYAFSNYFSCRPFIGVRGLFMRQNYQEKFLSTYNTANLTANLKDADFGVSGSKKTRSAKIQGVGLRPGIDFLWSLSKNWGFYGGFSTSFLSTKSHMTDGVTGFFSDEELNLLTASVTSTYKKHQVLLNLESFIGLQLETLCCNGNFYLALKVGYEYSYWPQIPFADALSLQLNNPLTTQGGQASLVLSF